MSSFLSQKAQQFTESVIREMSRICTEVQGINLAQGFPDHDPINKFKEAAKKAIDAGHNQYAVTWGAPAFREAIARKVTDYNRIPCDPQKNITVTCGATEAMICALLATTNPGDEVIIFEPFYENYGPDCILSGAKPVFVALKPEDGHFKFDPVELKKAVSPKTKAIIINTPSNPLGKVFTHDELTLISKVCIENDLLAITDEIYEYILYPGHQHVSIGSLPGMSERTLTISGCSKTYSVTGWRLAYIIASEEITKGLRKVHDFLTVGAPHPLQIAGVAMLESDDQFYQALRSEFQKRKELLFDILKSAGFTCYEPEGAYYILTDLHSMLGKTLTNDVDFTMWMTREVGVAAVPGSSFYQNKELGSKQIRFTFSKSMDTLQKAGEKLQTLQSKLPR